MKIKRRSLLTGTGLALAAWLIGRKPPLPLNAPVWPFDGPRVVTLEYHLTEMVLQLGVRPIGVADIKGYARWVGFGRNELAHSTAVGTRQQPALAYIAALKPDVILGVDFRHRSILPVLQRIAPTVLLPDAGSQNGLLTLQQTWHSVAAAVQRQHAAAQLWQTFERQLERLHADRAGTSLAVLQGIAGTPTFWGFAPNSTAGALALRLGWRQADIISDRAPQGIVQLDVARLLDSQTRLAVMTDRKRSLIQGEIWQSVPAIRRRHYRILPAGNWPFGGLDSSLKLAEALSLAWRSVEENAG